MSTLLECPKCGWVHFAVSEEYVQKWEAEWAEYARTWPAEQLAHYGLKPNKPPTRDSYLHCFFCGNDEIDKFIPDSPRCQKVSNKGHTIQSILWEPK